MKSVLISKNNEQKMFMILYYESELYWFGYDINEDNLKEGQLTINKYCDLNIDYKDISFFNETEEFISSFRYKCKINGKYNIYNFLYSFDKNFKYTFLGAIRKDRKSVV